MFAWIFKLNKSLFKPTWESRGARFRWFERICIRRWRVRVWIVISRRAISRRRWEGLGMGCRSRLVRAFCVCVGLIVWFIPSMRGILEEICGWSPWMDSGWTFISIWTGYRVAGNLCLDLPPKRPWALIIGMQMLRIIWTWFTYCVYFNVIGQFF